MGGYMGRNAIFGKHVFVLALLGTALIAAAQPPNFVDAVKATNPIAYYRLESTSGNSEVGNTTYTSSGGVVASSACAPIGVAGNHCVRFNGIDGMIDTTQMGGITTAASIMAWVNLSSLPSKAQRIYYVAGESQNGNDLDLQFEPGNDTLKFFTASGSHVEYTPKAGTLLGHWHMIVATFDTSSGARALYWDGKPVASDRGGGVTNKTHVFTIAESPTFTGRWFDGRIEEVALWDRALDAKQIAALYRSTLK
jgi:hypothetical protein